MTMNKISGSAFIFMAALGLLLPVIGAGQAGAEEQATSPTLTPAQARRTLSILQDDAKRAELEQTLRAIAQATAEALPANTPEEVSATAARSSIILRGCRRPRLRSHSTNSPPPSMRATSNNASRTMARRSGTPRLCCHQSPTVLIWRSV